MARAVLDGVLIEPPDMPRSYVLTLLGLELPEVLLLTGVAGLGGAPRRGCSPANHRRGRGRSISPSRLAAPPASRRRGHHAAGDVQRPSGISCSCCRRWRSRGGLAGAWIVDWTAAHFRPCGAGRAGHRLCRRPSHCRRSAWRGLHPYEYVYFNHIAGGVRGRRTALHARLLGSGLQAGRQRTARQARRRAARCRRPAAKWTIAVCGPHPPAQVAPRQTSSSRTWDPKGADFALMLGVFYLRQARRAAAGRRRARRRQLRASL